LRDQAPLVCRIKRRAEVRAVVAPIRNIGADDTARPRPWDIDDPRLTATSPSDRERDAPVIVHDSRRRVTKPTRCGRRHIPTA